MELLIKKAKEARENAYAPYSKFKVGAAVMDASGEIFTGCNIENASYGLTNCAERTAIFKAVSAGSTDLRMIALIADIADDVCTPCGACRQVIAEFLNPSDPVVCANTKGDVKVFTVAEILPGAFSPKALKG